MFWPELPKMLSVLYENLASDDMQDDASYMLQFFLKCKEMFEIGSKSWFFDSFWEFFVYALLHSELHPKTWPNKRSY